MLLSLLKSPGTRRPQLPETKKKYYRSANSGEFPLSDYSRCGLLVGGGCSRRPSMSTRDRSSRAWYLGSSSG